MKTVSLTIGTIRKVSLREERSPGWPQAALVAPSRKSWAENKAEEDYTLKQIGSRMQDQQATLQPAPPMKANVIWEKEREREKPGSELKIVQLQSDLRKQEEAKTLAKPNHGTYPTNSLHLG